MSLSLLALAATLRLEAPLFLTIREAEVSGSTAINDAVIFTGEIVSAGPKGSVITAKAVSAGSMFDRKVPRVVFSTTDNNALFDTGSGLLKADWKFSAAISDPGTPGYPFEFVLKTLAGVGANAITELAASHVVANWFAGGWIEFGTGANWQARPILLSTSPVAGVFTVTLDKDPGTFPAVNDAVVLYPGCDLQYATLINKFGNGDNIIGQPFMPLANPSIVRKNQTAAGGKK